MIEKLDPKSGVDLLKNTEEERAKLGDFLSLLNYPMADSDQCSLKVYQGSKKDIYPVLYFILQNFENL